METLAKDTTPVETLETPSVGPGDSSNRQAAVRFSGSVEVCTELGLGLESTESGVKVSVYDERKNDSAQVAEGKTLSEENRVGVSVEEVGLVKTRAETEISEIVIEGDNDNGSTVPAEDMVPCENGKDHVDDKIKDSSFAERAIVEGNGVRSGGKNAPVEYAVSVLEENERKQIGDIVGTRTAIETDTVVETKMAGASEGLELPAGKTNDVLVGSSLMMDGSLKERIWSLPNGEAWGAQLNSENRVKVMNTGVSLTENGKDSEMENKGTGVLETRGGVEKSSATMDAADADVCGNGTEEKENEKEDQNEEEDMEEEETDAQEYQFSVGDFVWGKIKSHPWWPGQVYDPSDASDYAGKHHRRDRLLVAYFGDGTFAWCYPSQLKPFSKDFEKMSKQSNSKSFLNAVEKALNEFGRCVLSEMTLCVLEESRSAFARPLAVNAGLRPGVSVPVGRIGEFSVTEFEPENFLVRLRDIAQVVSISNMLELTVLKGMLSAFYLAKGYNQLPMYYHPRGVPGLEDLRKDYIPNKTNPDSQMDGLTSNPAEKVPLSSPMHRGGGKNSQNSSQKRPSISDDKLNQRKKQRSMAELMADNVESELENGGSEVAEEGTDHSNPALPSRKQKKTRRLASPSAVLQKNDDDGKSDSAVVTESTSSSKKKKRTKDLASPVTADKAESFGTANEDNGGEEGTILSSPRQRKRSKYLSYPYTIPSGLKSAVPPKDAETETSPKVSRVGESISRIAGQLTGAPPILKCSGETFQKKIPKEARPDQKTPGSTSPRTPKANQEKLPSEDSNVSTDEMLREFCSAAINPLHLKDGHTPNTVRSFFTRFRSSLYLNGSDFERYKKNLDRSGSRGRKSSATARSSLGKVPPDGTDLSAGRSGRKKRSSSEIEHKSSGKDSSSEINLYKVKRGRKKKDSSVTEANSLGKDSSGENNLSKGKPGRKKKNSLVTPNTTGKHSRAETDLSGGKSGRKRRAKTEESPLSPRQKSTGSLKQAGRSSGGRISNKEASAESAAALLLTFALGSALPSKDDLIQAFSKFGVLNESETEVLEDSACAQVVFVRSSDAEEALNNSEKINTFGPAVLSFRLRYLSAPSRTLENDGSVCHPSTKGDGANGFPPSGPAASSISLHFIKQNLEMMMSKLAESAEKESVSEAERLSPEVRANLAGEIRGLLGKVNALAEGSSY